MQENGVAGAATTKEKDSAKAANDEDRSRTRKVEDENLAPEGTAICSRVGIMSFGNWAHMWSVGMANKFETQLRLMQTLSLW